MRLQYNGKLNQQPPPPPTLSPPRKIISTENENQFVFVAIKKKHLVVSFRDVTLVKTYGLSLKRF